MISALVKASFSGRRAFYEDHGIGLKEATPSFSRTSLGRKSILRVL
jgi:hypothetical protein